MAKTTIATIECKHGICYQVELSGSKGEKARLKHLLENCCCWVCFNHNCSCPKNEKCDKVHCSDRDCSLFTVQPYCEKEQT